MDYNNYTLNYPSQSQSDLLPEISFYETPGQKGIRVIPCWVWIAVISILIIIIIGLFLLLPSNQIEDQEYTTAMDIPEDYNPELSVAIKTSEHYYYDTTNLASKYEAYSPYEICIVLDVSCTELAEPDKLDGFIKVNPLSVSGLNYYLDNGSIIIIHATGVKPYSKEGETIVIYATQFYDYVYLGFNPLDTDTNLAVEQLFYRSDIYNSMSGVGDFYVLNNIEVSNND